MFGAYAEAIKAFLINFRYIFIIAAILGSIWALDHNGYKRAEDKCNRENDEKALAAAKLLEEANKAVADKTLAYIQLSQQTQVIQNAKQKTIEDLASQLSSAKSRGLQPRKVCGGSSTTQPSKSNGSGVPVEPETSDSSVLSAESLGFFISEANRADEVGKYAETAYEWIQEVCKDKSIAVCGLDKRP